MALHSTDIEKEIRTLKGAIGEAEEKHKELAFRFAEGEAVQEQMIEQRAQVDYFKGVIRDNEAALEYAQQKEAKAHDASAIQRILDEVEAGKQLLARRVEVAKKLDKQFTALGKVMDEFMAVTEEARAVTSGVMDITLGYEFTGHSIFGKPPQIFGWQNAIKKAGLTEMAGPAFSSQFGGNDAFKDVTLADCIAKQHENLRYRKKVQLVLSQHEDTADV
ncbi:MAG: hypothetical protein KZQ90_11600 [Candidatus Thiodiazotropha sp. (ex Codakia rugifera)]|nr:hypothetical protein [Candidatus Thiodiazotropha sp. (ex Codakia rugifera)]